jgi:hypothetical protein
MKQVTLIITSAVTVFYDDNLTSQETVEHDVVTTLKSITADLNEYVDLPTEVATFGKTSVDLFQVIPTSF